MGKWFKTALSIAILSSGVSAWAAAPQGKQQPGKDAKDQGAKGQGGDMGSGQQGGDDQKDKPKDPRAQSRYPQPVSVGALAGRRLIEPEESQHVLGRVTGMVRDRSGGDRLVIETGGRFGWLGVGTRLVTVAADDVALLGTQVALTDVEPDDFRKLPSYRAGSLPSVNPRETIRMGIVKPFH